MKCPRCGYESGTDPLCSKCGFNHTESKDKIEVEYRDFKTSELLEIRQKRQSFPGRDAKTDGESRRNEPERSLAETRKKRFPVTAMIALLLALIALAYFFFRHILLK